VIVTAPGNPDDDGARRGSRSGEPTLHVRKRHHLHRFSIDGVAWGREIAYLDCASRFAAIVTRANMLPLEGVREGLGGGATRAARFAARRRRARRVGGGGANGRVYSVSHKARSRSSARESSSATPRKPIEEGVVIVRDGRIAAAGPRASVRIPTGVRAIDARGATIIPGLWDMHAHVALPEWGPEYLGVGVTTIRDMGAKSSSLTAFRDAIASGRVLGPRLLLAGLVDGSGPEAFGTVTADTPAQGRAVVEMYHAAGFQQMKLYTFIKPDVASAIIRRAHELGMSVTGHIPRADDTGVDDRLRRRLRGALAGTWRPVERDGQGADRDDGRRAFRVDPTVSWNELLSRRPRRRSQASNRIRRGTVAAPRLIW
jgi:hypothetical protein